MQIRTSSLPGHLIIEPKCFEDVRGSFLESFQEDRYREAGIAHAFVQDNLSRSFKGVFRGLHFQIAKPLARLVSVVRGHIFDVAVDLRPGSATFAKWVGVEMSETVSRQVYLPPGFAHGFCVLSDVADIHYKMSGFYDPSDEGGVIWNDPELGIRWPITPSGMSPRDAAFPALGQLSHNRLPR